MPREVKKFYEAQQYSGSGRWKRIGFFTTEKAAEKYCKEFNTGVEVSPVKIVEREFIA